MIGYADFHKTQTGYECGYCFNSRFQGQGYAQESLKSLFAALTSQGAKTITAGTALNNLPSVRLLERLGFKQVGEEEVTFYKDDQGQDIKFKGGIFELKL